jgi:hypothetical protein
MKFEPDAPDCNRITQQLRKKIGNLNLEKFPNLCLKIHLGKTKFEFFLVYLKLINHIVNA